MMVEPRDECRPVELPGGGTVLARGAEPLGEQDMAALAELVAVARRLAPEPDPGAAELYARLDEARDGRFWREVAREAGVGAAVPSRLANGFLPAAQDREKLEEWVHAQEDEASDD